MKMQKKKISIKELVKKGRVSQSKINKYALNEVIIPSKKNYSVILGLNPSQGARSPSLWNKAYGYFDIDSEMIPIDIDENNFSALAFSASVAKPPKYLLRSTWRSLTL